MGKVEAFFWIKLQNQKLITANKYCPFCGQIYDLKYVECPFCSFKVGINLLNKLLRIAKENVEKISYRTTPLLEVQLEKISSISQVEYQKEVENSSHPPTKAVIKINSDILSQLNEAHFGSKQISFWFCALLHEIVHTVIDKIYLPQLDSAITASRKEYWGKKAKYQEQGEHRTRRIVGHLLSKHPQIREECIEVLIFLGLPSDVIFRDTRDICSVAKCYKPAVDRCEWCSRLLCETHIQRHRHYPCRPKKARAQTHITMHIK